MKIGLEATRANKIHKTGTEWYAWHLLEQFKKLDQNNEFIIYYNHDLAEPLANGPANFSFKKLSWPFKKLWTHFRLSFELIFYQVVLSFFHPIFQNSGDCTQAPPDQAADTARNHIESPDQPP